MLVFSAVVYGSLLIICIAIIIRVKSKSKGLKEESVVYKEISSVMGREIDFSYDNYSREVRRKTKMFNVQEMKHAIAIIEGNIQATTVDAIVVALSPTLFSFCSSKIADEITVTYKSIKEVEVIANSINAIVVGIFLLLIAPMYLSLKRQKYICTILQYEIDERGLALELDIEHEIKSLKAEIEDLKSEIRKLKKETHKKKCGIQITIDR